MTYEEKFTMYMGESKENLIKMLIQANESLDIFGPVVVIEIEQQRW